MPRDTTRTGRRCTSDAVALGIATTARTLLLTAVALLLWALVPACLGWPTTTVVSGSMAPAVQVGDVVAAAPLPETARTPGRVLLVDDPDHPGRLRLHRLDQVRDDGMLVLRGDANPRPDRSAVSPSAVRGVALLRFPAVGLPATWLREATSRTSPERSRSCSRSCSSPSATGRSATALRVVGAARRVRTSSPRRPPCPVGLVVPVTLLAVLAAVTAAAIGTGSGCERGLLGGHRRSGGGGDGEDLPVLPRVPGQPVAGVGLRREVGSGRRRPRPPPARGDHGERASADDASCTGNPSLRFEDADDPRVHQHDEDQAPSTSASRSGSGRSAHRAASCPSAPGRRPRPSTRTAASTSPRTEPWRSGCRTAATRPGGRSPRPLGSTTAGGTWPSARRRVADGALAGRRRGGRRTDNTEPFTYDGYWRVGLESTADWPAADEGSRTSSASRHGTCLQPRTAVDGGRDALRARAVTASASTAPRGSAPGSPSGAGPERSRRRRASRSP